MKSAVHSADLALTRRPPANLNATLPPSLREAPTGVTGLASLPIGVLLDALADRVADRLLARTATPQQPEHASARENPLGTARAFLDAGRRGDLPTFKRGREVVARWIDVLAYIERRTVARKDRPAPSAPKLAPSAPQRSAAPSVPDSPDDRRRKQLRAANVLPSGC